VRAVLQRASEASVSVGGIVVGRLPQPGLVVLVGVTHSDTAATAAALARKIYYLRVLRDEKSCADVSAPLLIISQFTLYGETSKGRRPTWQAAAPGGVAEPLVEAFVGALRELGAGVETGIFGADMQVELINDGPVTLIVEQLDPPIA
jgi:D-tyrosyl-tRNA(Tyr) deacylase